MRFYGFDLVCTYMINEHADANIATGNIGDGVHFEQRVVLRGRL